MLYTSCLLYTSMCIRDRWSIQCICEIWLSHAFGCSQISRKSLVGSLSLQIKKYRGSDADYVLCLPESYYTDGTVFWVWLKEMHSFEIGRSEEYNLFEIEKSYCQPKNLLGIPHIPWCDHLLKRDFPIWTLNSHL